MRIAGNRTVAAPPDVVFAAIHDPAVLLACIPGCRDARQLSATEYEAQLALRLPVIAGSYRLSVRVLDATAPTRCQLEGRVDGRPGTISGQATLDLSETDGGTRLDYRADARIEGPIAWLDSTVVERVASTLLDQGFDRLDRDLARRTGPGGPAAQHDRERRDREPREASEAKAAGEVDAWA